MTGEVADGITQPMRIVYFIDHLRADGAQKYLVQLVTGLAERNHEQLVICLNDSYDDLVVSQLRQTGTSVCIVGKVPLITGYGLLRIVLLLYRSRCDAVITCLFASDVIGRLLGRLCRVPRIITSIQNRNVKYTPLQRRLVRFTMRWADTVVFNSANVRTYAVTHEAVPPGKTCVIPNAICVDAYRVSPDRSAVRKEFGIPSGGMLVGSVGRLTHQKGFDILLQALQSLSSPEWHLLLIGTGELRAALANQAEALGVRDRIHFAGFRHDVPRLLKVLDLYVQPSRFEGMPNAVLEAMAAGRPIVATAVDGIAELIEDGRHGRLVPTEDVSALATAIRTLLVDGHVAQQYGTAARERAKQFGLRKMISAWEALLADSGAGAPT